MRFSEYIHSHFGANFMYICKVYYTYMEKCGYRLKVETPVSLRQQCGVIFSFHPFFQWREKTGIFSPHRLVLLCKFDFSHFFHPLFIKGKKKDLRICIPSSPLVHALHPVHTYMCAPRFSVSEKKSSWKISQKSIHVMVKIFCVLLRKAERGEWMKWSEWVRQSVF